MSFWDTYVSPYIADFTSGWTYGDEAESYLDLPESGGLSSFLYTAGDYAEDVYDYAGTAASTAWDWTKKGVTAWQKGSSALSELSGGKERTRTMPTPKGVSADGRYSPGSFTSGQAANGRIGQSNSTVQQGMRRMSQNSDLAWVARLGGDRVPLTRRGGATTMRISTNTPISVRSSTKVS